MVVGEPLSRGSLVMTRVDGRKKEAGFPPPGLLELRLYA